MQVTGIGIPQRAHAIFRHDLADCRAHGEGSGGGSNARPKAQWRQYAALFERFDGQRFGDVLRHRVGLFRHSRQLGAGRFQARLCESRGRRRSLAG